jgi:hypothetical protein
MRGTVFLRLVFLGVMLAGCGDDPVPSFTPEDVAEEEGVDASDDIGSDFDVPEFDLPSQPDQPAPPDLTSPPDTTPPADRSMPPDTTRPPPDSAPMGMCPASCRADGDCNPCATPGDPGNYCCISGLCLYMTGACMAPPPDGGSSGGDAGDSGGGGGGDTGGAD